MSPHNTKNFLYYSSTNKNTSNNSEKTFSDDELKKFFQILAKQSMKEHTSTLEDLESLLRDSITDCDKSQNQNIENELASDNSYSIIKRLQDMGYLKDQKYWLTNKAFFEIGNKLLQDVLRDLNNSGFGLHETMFTGNGSVIIDSTKKLEIGDSLKFLSAPQTLFNSIQRLAKQNAKITFPMEIHHDDFEQYETLEDVSVAIVYCIDLSSTMKTLLGESNVSRIEAAKKALWSLYVLNSKFFPNDSIYVVGFASMASIVNPFDIPFLKTYDANDNFLHYTNYQAALRLARKLLQKTSMPNKRIVLITDGQPSACFIDNESQKNEIISEKPYSNFYTPDESLISKIKTEKNMQLDSDPKRLVYLCYRYKKVDPKIESRTIIEAKKCIREGIKIDSIVISDELELLEYVQKFERELDGKTYHITQGNMDRVLVRDYLTNTRKVLSHNTSL